MPVFFDFNTLVPHEEKVTKAGHSPSLFPRVCRLRPSKLNFLPPGLSSLQAATSGSLDGYPASQSFGYDELRFLKSHLCHHIFILSRIPLVLQRFLHSLAIAAMLLLNPFPTSISHLNIHFTPHIPS
jgi:hypothetical protein